MEEHIIVWRGIQIEITFTPNQFGISDHVELRSENEVPLPVTGTGYRSNFMDIGIVAAHGGAVEFVAAWLDHEAEQAGWDGAQLSMF